MKKWITGLLAILCTLSFTGCGGKESEEMTTIHVGKDGSLTSMIVEAFDREYYGEEDLKEYTLDAVALYNAGGAEREVSVAKVEAADGMVKLQMKYKSAADYAGFNGKEMFCGTVAEAYDADIDLDVTLLDAADPSKTIGKSEILQMGEKKLVVLEENVAVEVPGKILYISDGTEVLKEKSVIAHPGDGRTYIIYK